METENEKTLYLILESHYKNGGAGTTLKKMTETANHKNLLQNMTSYQIADVLQAFAKTLPDKKLK